MSNLPAWIAAGSLGVWSLGWTGVVGYVLTRAALRRGRRPASGARVQSGRPRVMVMRPCAGSEKGLEDRLVSILDARGLDQVELSVSLTTGRPNDPAIEACEAAVARLSAAGIDAALRPYDLENGPVRPINQKVGQLAAAVADTEGDVFINVDSDVDLRDFDFGPIIERLVEDSHGAVWAAPIECGGDTRADADSAAVLDASLHAFGLIGELDPRTFVGKVFGVRRDALGQIGGFDPLGDWLGEDMELARRMLDKGWKVGKVETIARAHVRGRSPKQVHARYARWLAVIRWQRPHLLASYPLMFFAAPLLVLAWLVLAAASGPVRPVALAGALFVLMVRWALAAGARRTGGLSRAGALWAGLRADWVIARAWALCLRSSQVTWRGRTFERGDDGRMVLAASS